MKLLILAGAIAGCFAITPASAGMMACNDANMTKSMMMGNAMMDSPKKSMMMKEMTMANSAMSKGDMRGACKSYMRAQRMGM